MAEKLMHLPTKQTTVKPKTGEPFARRQHFNPNKDEPKTERTKAKLQEAKKRLQPLAAEKLLNPKERELAGGFSKSGDEFHHTVEQGFFDRVPEQTQGSNMKKIDGDNANTVYIVNQGTDGESFFKPRSGENHKLREGMIEGNFAGREVLAYELSKMLGADSLVPPTKMWGDDEGSIQMSAHRFGEKLGLSNIEKAFTKAKTYEGYKSQMDDIENIGDMMTFDFIIGNTDRHGFNFFVGEGEGGKKRAIAYDHGLAFTEDDANKVHFVNLTTETMRAIARSGNASTPVSLKFMSGIYNFNEGHFDHLRKAYGLSDEAAQGVKNRINSLKDHMKTKFAEAEKTWKPEDFNNMTEYKKHMIKQGMITAYDVAQVSEKVYNAVIG